MTKSPLARLGPYEILIRMVLLGMLTLSLSRILLLLWQYERIKATGIFIPILLQGIRADFILMCLGALIPALLALPWANQKLERSWFIFSYYWGLIWLTMVVFLELSTPGFIMQYDVRPDRLYVEYLKYPKEVFFTLWRGYKLHLLFGIGLTIFMAVLYGRWLKPKQGQPAVWPLRIHIVVWPLALLIIVAGIRSTTQKRPANPALFAITSDSLVNSLVINSGYSVLYAIYNLKHEANSSDIYGSLPIDEMLRLTRDWPWLKQYEYKNPEYPTLHWQEAAIKREKPLNIVIILQESLGATFVESLGGINVTPELEKLKEEGIWFENLYATGTRSVRGIEAVMAGYGPTPAQSTVKLSLSQKNFATIASILQQQGYQTSFVYGGEAHFDNMRGFFTGNGINEVIDLAAIKQGNPNAFIGSWGASDEDLFTKAHQALLQFHANNKPFFSLIFTSSNHEPFEFPEGRIQLHEEPANRVNNAVKYADWAMSQFLEKAKASPYWQDTVFLVVADHDNRVYGSNLVPLEKFKIPGLILGADIKPQKIQPLASQIDLSPTLLSLAGVSSCHPMDGRDFVADATSPGRALIQFNDIFGLMTETGITLLKPNQESVYGHYDDQQHTLTIDPEEPSKMDRNKALAQVQLPSYLYRKKKYPSNVGCNPQ